MKMMIAIFLNWDQLCAVMRVAEVKLIGKSRGLSDCDGISCTFVCAHQTKIDVSHGNIMRLLTTNAADVSQSLSKKKKKRREKHSSPEI